MSYAVDVLIIISLFTIYGYIHSILASNKVKKLFKKTFGNLIAVYRLLFNIFALASLYFIYELFPKPQLIIYDLPNPYDIIVLIIQLTSLAGFIWTFRYICFKEFIGLNQLNDFLNKNYNNELDERLTLRIEGPYRFMRHPLYFFSIIFLLFRPTMDLFYLTFFACIVAYFYIGSYFEEKKLMENFGSQYSDYKKLVPKIFPYKLIKPYKQEFN